jgi:hypothetical protein
MSNDTAITPFTCRVAHLEAIRGPLPFAAAARDRRRSEWQTNPATIANETTHKPGEFIVPVYICYFDMDVTIFVHIQ